MPTFAMLTSVAPEALRSPQGVEVLERVAMTAVRAATEWTRYKEMVRELPEIGTVVRVSG